MQIKTDSIPLMSKGSKSERKDGFREAWLLAKVERARIPLLRMK